MFSLCFAQGLLRQRRDVFVPFLQKALALVRRPVSFEVIVDQFDGRHVWRRWRCLGALFDGTWNAFTSKREVLCLGDKAQS